MTLEIMRARGACRSCPDDRFILVEDDEPLSADIALTCATCPVTDICLEWALQNEVEEAEVGVWGGTNPAQRRKLKKVLSRVKCPACGDPAIVRQGRGEICISCGRSWLI